MNPFRAAFAVFKRDHSALARAGLIGIAGERKMRNPISARFVLVFLISVCLSGCFTFDQKGLVGVYWGYPKADPESPWCCTLSADGTFAVVHPLIGEVSEKLPGPKESLYRGRWELNGKTLILRREDGGIEHLLVENGMGFLSLKPERKDQPVFFWEDRELMVR